MKVCPTCYEVYAVEASYCPADGTALSTSDDRYLGRTVASRYRLVRRLGQGGMSQVYLAKHVIIDRMSAIKILRSDLGTSGAYRERFLREARAVNRINHRNIVEISDVGEADGIAYLVMEYVEGTTLLDHIQRGPMAWPRALRIAAQIASALGRAHQLGVIHRDLKPENIMVLHREDESDFVKLTDFGIAKILDLPALTFSEQLFGTPGYIAPEFVEGIEADHRVDIYSLGVVLYEMLTGALPFEGRGQADLLLKPLSCDPIPPSSRVANLPPALEGLVLRMLARSREERPADAIVVQERLLELAQDIDPEVARISLPELLGAPHEARGARSTVVDSHSGEHRHLGEQRAAAASQLPAALTSVRPDDDTASLAETAVRASRSVPTHVMAARAPAALTPPAVSTPNSEQSTPPAAWRMPLPVSEPARARDPDAAPMTVNYRFATGLVDPSRPASPAAVFALPTGSASAPPPARSSHSSLRPPPSMTSPRGPGNWAAAIEDLEASILRASARGIAPDHASRAHALAVSAQDLAQRVERSASRVAVCQTLVDALQERGREFRSALGRAIDALMRDRSRERMRLEALRTRRAEVSRDLSGRTDSALWEAAQLAAEEQSVHAADSDFTFQIETLQRELQRRNEALEVEMNAAGAELEGALSAFRQLSRELATTLDEAARHVSASFALRVRPLV